MWAWAQAHVIGRTGTAAGHAAASSISTEELANLGAAFTFTPAELEANRTGTAHLAQLPLLLLLVLALWAIACPIMAVGLFSLALQGLRTGSMLRVAVGTTLGLSSAVMTWNLYNPNAPRGHGVRPCLDLVKRHACTVSGVGQLEVVYRKGSAKAWIEVEGLKLGQRYKQGMKEAFDADKAYRFYYTCDGLWLLSLEPLTTGASVSLDLGSPPVGGHAQMRDNAQRVSSLQ